MDDKALFYGDNLDVLRRYIKDETVDLIYLDPPFNSNADYAVEDREHRASLSAAAQDRVRPVQVTVRARGLETRTRRRNDTRRTDDRSVSVPVPLAVRPRRRARKRQ